MALAFGLGVTITLSFYGALIGLLGQLLGIHQVETAKNILYAVAGFLAILFALGELGLIKFQSPTYGGGVPQFVLKQKDLLKALLLGLFLGNVGVGCPNPLFNAVIIPQIVATGSPFQGLVIMLVQALGRITPLFILAFLAILGINATSFLVKHKEKVTQVTAWTTLFVSIFAIIIAIVGFLLPHMFTAHWSEKATDRHDEEMNTVQNINATTSDFHSVLSSQSEIQASKPFVLKISLYDKKGLPITDLQLDHERILHVILVSEDLNEFKHVHPEDSKDFIVGTQANEFEVPLTVSKAGRYRVLIDGSRKGMGGVFDTVWLEVSGGKQLVAITKDLSRTRIFDGYEVTLGIDSDKIKAGHDSHLNYSIKKDGIAVFDTDEYLGAD